MFQQEFNYFKDNQKRLVEKYRGKILVLIGAEIVGVYNSNIEALNEATKRYKLGTFMIQPCEPGPEAYTITISSNVITV
jgi:hypothetical protein